MSLLNFNYYSFDICRLCATGWIFPTTASVRPEFRLNKFYSLILYLGIRYGQPTGDVPAPPPPQPAVATSAYG